MELLKLALLSDIEIFNKLDGKTNILMYNQLMTWMILMKY